MATEVDEAQRDALAERLFGAALGRIRADDRPPRRPPRPLPRAGRVGRRDRRRACRRDAERTSATRASGSSSRRSPGSSRSTTRRPRQASGATALPAGHAEVLVDRESLAYLTPMARSGVSFAHTLPAIEDAFRTGGGVSWEDYGQAGPRGAGRRQPAGVREPPRLGVAARRSRTSTRGCSPTRPPGSPTSPAAPAGRASRSPARTRR